MGFLTIPSLSSARLLWRAMGMGGKSEIRIWLNPFSPIWILILIFERKVRGKGNAGQRSRKLIISDSTSLNRGLEPSRPPLTGVWRNEKVEQNKFGCLVVWDLGDRDPPWLKSFCLIFSSHSTIQWSLLGDFKDFLFFTLSIEEVQK